MIRRMLGRLLEWLLSYEHVVVYEREPGAREPFHKYAGDAGYDLYSKDDVGIPPHATREVRSGIRLDPRDPVWLEMKARSSTLKVRGLEVVDAVIDRDYRGEMMAVVTNTRGVTMVIKAGERVVQVVPHRLIPLKFKEGRLSPSARGDRGFGSTGRS